ncbi:serine hydrolase-like protein [Onthophagus taurus]|uniref:serine hydrolase-like protein n=1 Tax=Onthophagus taurus TaxID=166361 RepID=UPI0039BE2674
MNWEEIKIKVPWGFVAAKSWGDSNNFPIILIHGLNDNAGSFDTLIPLLPQRFNYICIDLPGHGLSSHFPRTLPIEYTHLLMTLQIILDELKQDKYILIGHGISATLLPLYAQLKPEKVVKIVLIDSTYTFVNPPGTYLTRIEEANALLMKYINFKPENRKSYTYKEAVKKVIRRRPLGVLNYKCGEQLVRRMVEKVGEKKYMFTTDGRYKALVQPSLSFNYVTELLEKKPLKCDILVLYTSYTLDISTKIFKYMIPYLDLFKEHRIIIDGDHHIHHTQPEKVSNHIEKFLLN